MNVTDNDVKTIFGNLLDLDSPQEQAALIEKVCGDNEHLRAELQSLLTAHHASDSFLEQPASSVATLDMPPLTETVGSIIGPYKLMEQIGEGGMGVVYVAQQEEPVKRKVALKIIKPGMDTKQVIARFEAERQALVLMDHPNIAKVLDAGTTSEVRNQKSEIRKEELKRSPLTSDLCPLTSDYGRPYFVMELVQGLPITDYCDRHKLTTRERLELFILVCRAVQHAHQKAIIHRDLKPSNILVAEIDGAAVPKVIDFGIAKVIGHKLSEQTIYTQFSQLVGTPLYMSPEQAGLGVVDVDTRSDVYSLGVLLFELFTGSTPLDKETLKQAGYDEMRRIVREEEPHRPSARISTLKAEQLTTLSDQRGIDPRKYSHVLSGELDWIVMKALEKDRTRRYESASAFAADVERYLNDETVEACPPSTVYRLSKIAQRNKGLLSTVTLVTVALLVGTGVSIWQAVEADDARQAAKKSQQFAENSLHLAESREAQAISEAAKANAVIDLLEEMLSSANPDNAKGTEYTVRELLDSFSSDLSDQLKDQPEVEATIRTTIGKAYSHLFVLEQAETHLKIALSIRRRAADPEKLAECLLDNAWLLIQVRPSEAEPLSREALEIYRKHDSQSDGVLKALDSLQRCLYKLKKRVEGDAVAQEALTLARAANKMDHPVVPTILHSLGVSKRKQGEIDLAVSLGSEAVTLHRRVNGNDHPETAWGLAHLSGTLVQQGDGYAAAESARREAIAIFSQLYGRESALVVENMCCLGKIQEYRGNKAGAIQTYRETIAIHTRLPSNAYKLLPASQFLLESAIMDLVVLLPARNRNTEVAKLFSAFTPQTARGCLARGQYFEGTGANEKALSNYIRAIEFNPGHQGARRALMGLCKKQNFYNKALGALDKCIARNPANIKLKQIHTQVRKNQLATDKHEALAHYERGLELRPGYQNTMIKLTAIYQKLKQYDKALALLDKLIAADPENAELYQRRGVLYQISEQFEKTLDDYENPDYALRCNQTAWLIVRFPGEKTELTRLAVALAQKAVEQKPKSVSFSNTLGVAQYRAGNWPEAIDALQKSEELYKGRHLISNGFFLSMAHWQLGDKHTAHEWYKSLFCGWRRTIRTTGNGSASAPRRRGCWGFPSRQSNQYWIKMENKVKFKRAGMRKHPGDQKTKQLSPDRGGIV
jgi:serine/threonine protein kinase/Flp pilus assembly protein TadD